MGKPYQKPPTTAIWPQSRPCFEQIKDNKYSVLVGPNNCGKSYLVLMLKQTIAQSFFLSTSRYQNFELLDQNQGRTFDEYEGNCRSYAFQRPMIFSEQAIGLAEAIRDLDDSQRDKFFGLLKEYLSVDAKVAYERPSNSQSPPYISCDGFGMSYVSTGTRLMAWIFAILLNLRFKAILIDEPELGLSPENKRKIASFLAEKETRDKYFPHVEKLIVATHSYAFLDKNNARNNYRISKSGSDIIITQTQSPSEFHDISIFLLGNRLEDWSLPSLLVLTEGVTDRDFIERSISLAYPKRKVSVLAASKNDIPATIDLMADMLVDVQTTPYHNRIVAVADSVYIKGVRGKLATRGIAGANFVEWDNNGIEFVYPPIILDEIYGEGGDLIVSGNEVIRNTLKYKKTELCARVIERMTPETEHHPEFAEKFLKIVKEKLV